MRDPYCKEEEVGRRISFYLSIISSAEKNIKEATEDEEQGIQRHTESNMVWIGGGSDDLFQWGTSVFTAKYSLGEEIESLRRWFELSLKGLENMCRPEIYDTLWPWWECKENELNYVCLLRLTSMGILLEADDDAMRVIADGVRLYKTKDALIDFLLLACDIRWECYTGKFYEQRPYQYLKEVILTAQSDKEAASGLLKEYVKKKWLSGLGLKNYHKERGYVGAWSYEAAALAKILDLDDSCFRGKKNYPYDLAHYKDSKAFPARAYEEWLTKTYERKQDAERMEKEKEYVRTLEEDYSALDDEAFYEKYKETFMEELFSDVEEYSEYRAASREGILGMLLVNALVTDGYILQMDYKEEPEEYLLGFINERLEADYGEDMIEDVDTDDSSENEDACIEMYDTKYVKALGRKLRKRGYRFVWFLVDCDQYYVCIMPKKAAIGERWHELRLKFV